MKRKASAVKVEATDSSSESDVPLAKKIKKPATPSKKAVAKSPATKTAIKKETANSKATPAKKAKVNKEVAKAEAAQEEGEGDVDEQEYKWWLEQNMDNSVKWKTLSHNGVFFPPEYEPHGVPLVYNGKPVKLVPAVEEVASYFAQMLQTDYMNNPTFLKNFFRDFQAVIREHQPNLLIDDLSKCNFQRIFDHFDRLRERKKSMSKQERDKLKAEKQLIKDRYGVAILDGRKENVGNYNIEPPALFRGRGEHPRTGCLKRRIRPEDVTINIGKEAEVPAPPPGHQWKSVIHDNTVAWLATWKETVNDNTKYVLFAANSSLKGQSDLRKFEKARNLRGCVDKIRRDYMADLKDKVMATRQRATALYLIDKLALRAGNEKGEDEADTVGCCSLRFEHVSLEQPNTLVLDFPGKDSVRYYNAVPVDEQVFKNIRIFKRPPKAVGDPLFDRLNTTQLNKHLNQLMPGLSAKVFRTFNASHTLQEQLKEKTDPNSSVAEKVQAYNRANRAVAELCNHQRAVGKAHDTQMEKLREKVRAQQYQRQRYAQQLADIDPKLKKKRPELFKPEEELTEAWCLDHEQELSRKEREKVEAKFAKDNADRAEKKEALLKKSDLKDRLADIVAKDKLLAKGKLPTIKQFPPMRPGLATPERLIAAMDKITERIKVTQLQMEDKDENKTIALGTSKLNYNDPRITVAWAKANDVPLEKLFAKTLRDKFKWAMDVDADWEF
ncbi:DNA topoisomerase 1 [Tieghemiomyces parasiticus]|uniref:DNA topoisomerase I n=1 Tax=Tieghemiomyces parasiticus TaxID=78921 RepID=A0A9W8DMF9_9FUNG|nr:DNA topoisomerase 1 [Tieghemiomyces parasiticus]